MGGNPHDKKTKSLRRCQSIITVLGVYIWHIGKGGELYRVDDCIENDSLIFGTLPRGGDVVSFRNALVEIWQNVRALHIAGYHCRTLKTAQYVRKSLDNKLQHKQIYSCYRMLMHIF